LAFLLTFVISRQWLNANGWDLNSYFAGRNAGSYEHAD
jgi:hypothetical protein